MYEARFTTKQVYDNYAKSVSKPKNANQQAARTMSSVGIGSLGGKTTTASAKKIQDSFKEKRERRRKNKGSTYDEVPQVLTQGIVKRPAPKPSPEKTTGYEKVKRIFNSAMERFGIIDEPTSTYDTVKPQKIYKDNRYFGPAVFMPNTSNFKGDTDFTNYVPKILENLGVVSVRTGDYLDSSTLPTDVENPSLNMFGVSRGFTKPPAGLMSPPSVEMPANLDPISRALSLAFRPPSMPTTAEYTVSEGESLLTVLDTLNAGKPNSQKVTLEEIGKLNNIPDVVADPFGKIKKGDVLQVPIKKQTAVGDLRDQIEKERSIKRAIIEFERLPESEKKNIRERYRLRKQAQPASYTEEENKILKELERLDKDVANYVREFFDKQSEERLQKLAEKVGVDIKGKDVSGFGGMGPDPSTGKGIMSPDYSTVEKAQERLNDLGYTTVIGPLVVDNDLGPATRRQLRKFQATAGIPITGELDEATQKALRKNSNKNKEGKDPTAIATDLSEGLFQQIKAPIAKIESGGEAEPYAAVGGDADDYDGKYQFGWRAKEDLRNNPNITEEERAKLFHEEDDFNENDPSRVAFRADPNLQEKAFRLYINQNHDILTKNSAKYRAMDEKNKLAVLAYAHNQGAEAALEWLTTTVSGTDAFGTRGDKYSEAVVKELKKKKKGK